jgi:predicted DNA-binding transcriptional regulator
MSSEIVYNLMARGIRDRKEISYKTGLNPRQVQGALNNLYRKGKLRIKEVKKVRGSDFYEYDVNENAPKAHIFDRVNSIFNVGLS